MFKTLTLPKLIRRLSVGLPLAALLVGVTGTGVAAAKPGPPPPPSEVSCGTFTALVTPTLYNEKITSTILPDGTQVVRVTGVILLTVTNETTPKTVKANSSATDVLTYYPDGSATIISNGPAVLTGSPPQPLLSQFRGRIVWMYDPLGNLTSVSSVGQFTDLCAALS